MPQSFQFVKPPDHLFLEVFAICVFKRILDLLYMLMLRNVCATSKQMPVCDHGRDNMMLKLKLRNYEAFDLAIAFFVNNILFRVKFVKKIEYIHEISFC